MQDQVTPIVLTCNEAPNIGRALSRLQWARDIVLVDSYSEDETLSIAQEFPQVRIFQREFDCLAKQWNYALKETGICTEWVLALDADYILTDALLEEMKELQPTDGTAGYGTRFQYCIEGRPLRGTAYPPVTVLYRLKGASYRQDGHAHRVLVDGRVEMLRSRIRHDDRKTLTYWLLTQDKYMKQEVEKLQQAGWREISWADRLRKMRFPFPFVIFLYCLFLKGGVLDGRAGLYYAFQRMLAETLLSLHLLTNDLRRLTGAIEEDSSRRH